MNKKAIILGLVIVVVVAGAVLIQKGSIGATGKINDPAKAKGKASAKIQIVEYSDFQCPACKRALPVVEKIMNAYPGKINFQFRNFPLSGHQWAKTAHQAAQCAAEQKKFWPYHDKLYAEQEKWSVLNDVMTRFVGYAQEVGLNLDKFGSCLANEQITQKILAERDEGVQLKVRSTPTFFINGKRFVGSRELDETADAFIRSELGLEK